MDIDVGLNLQTNVGATTTPMDTDEEDVTTNYTEVAQRTGANAEHMVTEGATNGGGSVNCTMAMQTKGATVENGATHGGGSGTCTTVAPDPTNGGGSKECTMVAPMERAAAETELLMVEDPFQWRWTRN